MTHKGIHEIVTVETDVEANEYLNKGWSLLESVSYVEDNKPKFKFVLGKTDLVWLKEQMTNAEE